MGRMNVSVIRYLESQDFRVLIAIEMGMRNHELVPLQLIAATAKINRGAVTRILVDLAKHSAVAHERGKSYDGYRLTTLGYDILALKTLSNREVIGSVGNQIGVGKESDIYLAGDSDHNVMLKFHRLGRTSFRKLKEKRDYHKKRKSCSWLYLSSLAAAKEFAYLKALYAHDFPLPRPIDRCRHLVVMDLIVGTTLCHVQHVSDAEELYEKLMAIIVRLARYGLIHGDFNEFNIMLIKVTIWGRTNFDRSTHGSYKCKNVFRKRCELFNYESELYPKFEEMKRKHNLDVEVRASGFTSRMAKDFIRVNISAEAKLKDKVPLRVKGKASAAVRQKKTNADIIKEFAIWDF
ncbi:unnamed protein product [Thelazia callipaeda]|uniref:Serine/threonine-protein kinase RIO2 n=1 Tax=Thelazia callipaeda TaxID=103827 RepID=A0A0N5CUH2_THECL|nr:unnamed protein product [Thelazia callipaeda]